MDGKSDLGKAHPEAMLEQNKNTWRKPKQRQGEHALHNLHYSSTQSHTRCESAVLNTEPLCHPDQKK